MKDFMASGRTKWVTAGLLAISGLTTSCWLDHSKPKIQYVPDMADSPTLKPQENFLEPPPHSVPIDAILYPTTVEEGERLLKNPLPPNEMVLTRGKKMYETYCVPCHGVAAKGDGPVTDLFPKPPDITADFYRQKGDGYIFHRITFGSSIMPSYGHATSPAERWAIVHYLRTLQQPAGSGGK